LRVPNIKPNDSYIRFREALMTLGLAMRVIDSNSSKWFMVLVMSSLVSLLPLDYI